jgi:hypothetical protein
MTFGSLGIGTSVTFTPTAATKRAADVRLVVDKPIKRQRTEPA